MEKITNLLFTGRVNGVLLVKRWITLTILKELVGDIYCNIEIYRLTRV